MPACAHRRLGINADGCAARLLHCPVVGSLAAACVTVGGPDSGSSVDEGGTDGVCVIIVRACVQGELECQKKVSGEKSGRRLACC